MDSTCGNIKFSQLPNLSSSHSSEIGVTERLIQLFNSCDRDQDGLIDKLDLLTICERYDSDLKRDASFYYEEMLDELGLRDDSARIDFDKFLRCRRYFATASQRESPQRGTLTAGDLAAPATESAIHLLRGVGSNASTLPFSSQRGSRASHTLSGDTQKEPGATQPAVLESSASDNSLVSGSGDQYDSGAQDLAGEPMSLLALLRKAQPVLHGALCDALHLNESSKRPKGSGSGSGSLRRDEDALSLNDCLSESLLRTREGDLGSCRSLVDEFELRECVARALAVCNALHLDALAALKRELHEQAALVRQANARCAKLERDCERYRVARTRVESETEALVARYEDRLTELHSVIVEQHRKLEAATQRSNVHTVIYEEDEDEENENDNENENETETSSERDELDEPSDEPSDAKLPSVSQSQSQRQNRAEVQPPAQPQDAFQPIAVATNCSTTQPNVARPSPTRTRTPPVLLGSKMQEIRNRPRAIPVPAPVTQSHAQVPLASVAPELKSPSVRPDSNAATERAAAGPESGRPASAASESGSGSAKAQSQATTPTQTQTHALLSAEVRSLDDAARFVEYLATISTNGALSDRLAECTHAIERVAITSADREAYVRLLQTQLAEARNRRELHALTFGAACANLERQISQLDKLDSSATKLNRVASLRRRALAADRAALGGLETDWLADELAAAAASTGSSIFESRFDRLDETGADFVVSDDDDEDDLVSTLDDTDADVRASESTRNRLNRRIITELEALANHLSTHAQIDAATDQETQIRRLYAAIVADRRDTLASLRTTVADLRITDTEERTEPEAEADAGTDATRKTSEPGRPGYSELCYEVCNLENELAAVKHEKLELKTRLYYTEKEVTLLRWRSDSERQRCAVAVAELEHVRSENQLLKSLITDSNSGVSSSQPARIVEELEAQRAKLLELTNTISSVVDDAQVKQEQTVQLVAELKQTNFALIRAFERVKSKYQAKIKTQQDRIRQLLGSTTPSASAAQSLPTPTLTVSSCTDFATAAQSASKSHASKQSTAGGGSRKTPAAPPHPHHAAPGQLSDSNSNSSAPQRHANRAQATVESCGTPTSLSSSRSTGTPTHTPAPAPQPVPVALQAIPISQPFTFPSNALLMTVAPCSPNEAVFVPRNGAAPNLALPVQPRGSSTQPQPQGHLAPNRPPNFPLAGQAFNQPLGIGVASPTFLTGPSNPNGAPPLLRTVNANANAIANANAHAQAASNNGRPLQPTARRSQPRAPAQPQTQGASSLSETTI